MDIEAATSARACENGSGDGLQRQDHLGFSVRGEYIAQGLAYFSGIVHDE
jgi:hypothetical protein